MKIIQINKINLYNNIINQNNKKINKLKIQKNKLNKNIIDLIKQLNQIKKK